MKLEKEFKLTKNVIYYARIKKNISQQELAEMLGTTAATISRYENGIHKPQGKTAIKLSKILEIPLEEIIV